MTFTGARGAALCSDHVSGREDERSQEQLLEFSGKENYSCSAEPDQGCRKPTQEAPGQLSLSQLLPKAEGLGRGLARGPPRAGRVVFCLPASFPPWAPETQPLAAICSLGRK